MPSIALKQTAVLQILAIYGMKAIRRGIGQSCVRFPIGDEIHCIMGYGDTQSDILSEDADASQRDNIQHLIYGKTLRYVIRDAALSGSIFSALAEIAKLVDATLSIENGIIHIRQRRALNSGNRWRDGNRNTEYQL